MRCALKNFAFSKYASLREINLFGSFNFYAIENIKKLPMKFRIENSILTQ